MTEPPRLSRPDEIVMRLADRLGIHGAPAEATYLSSRNPRHRWAAESFSHIHDEFQFKAIWVAKQLRERFGPPDHLAYVALAESRLIGMRAAAWPWEGAIVFVSLRRAGQAVSWKGRPWLEVILGAMRPAPPTLGGPEGDDARAAVFVPAVQLVH